MAEMFVFSRTRAVGALQLWERYAALYGVDVVPCIELHLIMLYCCGFLDEARKDEAKGRYWWSSSFTVFHYFLLALLQLNTYWC
jgi:hypothetical protein